MKAEEARDLSVEEIDDKVGKLKKELFTMRIQAKTGKLEKQSLIKVTRRSIARLLTIRKEQSTK